MFKFLGSLLGIIFVIVLGLVGYTFAMLNWSYSVGDRAGYVQKLSKKGWVCKTWEGEIALVTMPGTVAEKFYFTVRDEEIAEKINQSIGQRIVLAYEEHVGLPTSCFGDTRYFITGIKSIEPNQPIP
ncbi:hypothetical protein LPTSP4_22960 [Leptospira ryugenii]|uniref:6-phosphogluconate dehydrogenase n=1 Tax=Leptospira ryugenii TaxID=1917863 RepID=A0A2P2E1L0_9LEPT|nr:hypothetical protein [Leptospira ryugenii]GBF50769.1 hypothetical protein LPTSP4_22960 [Leptospira ryugenii]